MLGHIVVKNLCKQSYNIVSHIMLGPACLHTLLISANLDSIAPINSFRELLQIDYSSFTLQGAATPDVKKHAINLIRFGWLDRGR